MERNHGSPIDRLAHDDTQMFIARIAGQAVGCAGLQVFADGTGEVKRMYVVTEFRGNWNRQQAPDARCGSGLDRQAVGSAAGNHGISSRCPEALSGEGIRTSAERMALTFPTPINLWLREMADEMMAERDVADEEYDDQVYPLAGTAFSVPITTQYDTPRLEMNLAAALLDRQPVRTKLSDWPSRPARCRAARARCHCRP